MQRKPGFLIATTFLLASFATAQDVERFNVAVSEAGVFSKSSTSSDGALTLKPTNSGETFGSVRWRLNHFHALEVNIGHTSNSQAFTVAPNSFRVATGITEYSGDYVLSPISTKHWEPFLMA